MIEENHEKTSVRLVGTGIWTWDLPNASLVRYHGATLLGNVVLMWNCSGLNIKFLPPRLNSAPRIYSNERFSYDLDGSD